MVGWAYSLLDHSSERRLMLRGNLVASELLDSFLGTRKLLVNIQTANESAEHTHHPMLPCRPSAKRQDRFEE